MERSFRLGLALAAVGIGLQVYGLRDFDIARFRLLHAGGADVVLAGAGVVFATAGMFAIGLKRRWPAAVVLLVTLLTVNTQFMLIPVVAGLTSRMEEPGGALLRGLAAAVPIVWLVAVWLWTRRFRPPAA